MEKNEEEDINTYVLPSHFALQKKLTQHCESNILQ